MAAIVVDALSKHFRVRNPTQRGLLHRLFRRVPTKDIVAVRDVTFKVAQGERVAFIGPNGAGKSTTLKMLTGILHPSSGHAEVAGIVPWQQRRELASKIGIVFGQRSQLWFHLPVRDSFDLLSRIYSIDRAVYRARLKVLASTFDIEALLARPVSELSLGQRIRCEIVAALLHAPAILLLDEPTIGLDVTAKAALRDHLNALSAVDGTTVLLTSHDTGDIEKICDRVIVIDQGALLLDEPLDRLRKEFLGRRSVVVVTAEENPTLEIAGTTMAASEPYRITLSVDIAQTTIEQVVSAAFRQLNVRDLIIENPPLEDIVKAIYRGSSQRGRKHASH
jgi:ABC-2 type transport system ATP-binding protein